MCEMFRVYCQAVRKFPVSDYSSAVQQALLFIDANLSGDLSTSSVAGLLGLSVGYLSTLFKKEMNKTLSEYVRERRMEYAAYLLCIGELQIQTVALHCGIMDVQYFSKLFKRHHGMSPTEYRAQHRNVRKL
ncbi:MAG: helix-turn-helix transcriptional regulator [Ruminococcaceae bacterium]|nr:helix-turn-helix transcriptional regulator [Oscillospiraceae bacterium]